MTPDGFSDRPDSKRRDLSRRSGGRRTQAPAGLLDRICEAVSAHESACDRPQAQTAKAPSSPPKRTP